jgi:hypothetical protein
VGRFLDEFLLDGEQKAEYLVLQFWRKKQEWEGSVLNCSTSVGVSVGMDVTIHVGSTTFDAPLRMAS